MTLNNFGTAVVRQAKHGPRGRRRHWLVFFHGRIYTYITWHHALCAARLLSSSYVARPGGLVGVQYDPDRKVKW
jgi:hypothetical protein